jgi:aspartate beta-hydroxylase
VIPLPERFAAYIAMLRDLGERPSMAHYPGLPQQPWYDANAIPLARDLERAAPRIIAEYAAWDAADFAPEREPIARTGAWDVVLLYERGRRHDERLAPFPAIRAAIETNRTVRSLAGLVYLSRLAPGTRVAEHTGPTNMRIRVHLGIDVPDGCGIRAGGVSATWQTGRCIAFDDSYPHEVWNASDRARIVLVADVWHPDLSDDEVRLLGGFHRYVEYAAEGLQRYWSANGG